MEVPQAEQLAEADFSHSTWSRYLDQARKKSISWSMDTNNVEKQNGNTKAK